MRTSSIACLLALLLMGCPTAEKCGPTSCFGCCTAAGECVTGRDLAACGASGLTCSICTPQQTCQLGTCVTALSQGGGSGSTGGGQGGGSGGGVTQCHTCASLGKNCGTIADGCGATLDCGTCMSPSKCGWGNPAVPNVCGVGGCTPETDREFCERLGKNCGAVVDWDNRDNSRTVASCGTCVDPQTCGGATKNV